MMIMLMMIKGALNRISECSNEQSILVDYPHKLLMTWNLRYLR